MKIEFPVNVEYGTPDRVPISDIIDSLSALRQILEEGTENLGIFVPDLTIEKTLISVKRISQESPLRELLLVTLFLTFQKDLEVEIPSAIETFTGQHVPDNYKTIVVLCSLIVVYYGLGYAKDVISKITTNTILKTELDEVIDGLSKQVGVKSDDIRKVLKNKYCRKKSLKAIAVAAIKFLRPSREQNNAPIEFGGKHIEPRLIAETPRQYELEEALKVERARSHRNVALEIHAQDKDRESTGWAAVPKGIDNRRLKVKLVDGVSPEQLWNKDEVTADVVMKYRRTGEDFEPYEIHITRVKE